MTINLPQRTATVFKEVDVVVVGGGPAGIGASVAAARQGAKTLLLEKRGFLGGNITACYVETCNWFMNGLDFQISGIYAELEAGYRARFVGREGDNDIRPNAPHRFSSEYLKAYLDDFVKGAGVEVCLHSFVNEIILDNDKITHVVIQSKQGPMAIKAKQVIDCSGDGDAAFAAGIPFDQGRDKDHRCQPGTVNFRVANVDPTVLVKDGKDLLKEMNTQFKKDYNAGKTGLSCKRQDIPTGRLTEGGQVSYINYPCAYGIDPTNFADLTRGEMECRGYILEMMDYMRKNLKGFEHAELSSIAPEIGFRDSRRFHGEYRLTAADVIACRKFDDSIAMYPQFYDMLSPDANMNESNPKDAGNNGFICSHPQDGVNYTIPYRALVPVKTENLLLAGRCISADHVAEAGIRAISACMYTGQAAGTAAVIALKNNIAPRKINVKELQDSLRAQKLII